MMLTVEATYERGVLVPSRPLPIADRERVNIVIHRIEPQEVARRLEAVERSTGRIKVPAELSATIRHIIHRPSEEMYE